MQIYLQMTTKKPAKDRQLQASKRWTNQPTNHRRGISSKTPLALTSSLTSQHNGWSTSTTSMTSAREMQQTSSFRDADVKADDHQQTHESFKKQNTLHNIIPISRRKRRCRPAWRREADRWMRSSRRRRRPCSGNVLGWRRCYRGRGNRRFGREGLPIDSVCERSSGDRRSSLANIVTLSRIWRTRRERNLTR